MESAAGRDQVWKREPELRLSQRSGRDLVAPAPARSRLRSEISRASAALAIVVIAGLLGAGGAAASEVPTFGLPSEPQAEGFGEVRPATIFLGGDVSGLVSHIHWRRWGKPKALGRGKGWYIPPGGGTSDGHTARARVVAWDLGYCGGQYAYRRAEWYFPEYHRHGHYPEVTYFDPKLAMHICAGHYPYQWAPRCKMVDPR